MSEPLSLRQSASLLGRYRYVELACFAHLGARPRPARLEPRVALYLAGAARAHAWRAELIEARLPVSVGLPGAAELMLSPGPALEEALVELAAGDSEQLLGALCGILYPAMLAAYRAHAARCSAAADPPIRRLLGRLVGDLDAVSAEAPAAGAEGLLPGGLTAAIEALGGPFGRLEAPA